MSATHVRQLHPRLLALLREQLLRDGLDDIQIQAIFERGYREPFDMPRRAPAARTEVEVKTIGEIMATLDMNSSSGEVLLTAEQLATLRTNFANQGLSEDQIRVIFETGRWDRIRDTIPIAPTAETAPEPWQTECPGRWVKVGKAWGWLDDEQNAIRVVSGVTTGYRTFAIVNDAQRDRWLPMISGSE